MSPRHGASSGCGWRNGLWFKRWPSVYWISSRRKTTRAGPPAWGLGEALTTPQCENWPVTKQIHVPQSWSDPLVRPKQWKRNMRFCIWNVRTLYRSGSLTTVTRELARYKLDLVDIQEVGWGQRGHCKSRGLYFFLRKRKIKSSIGNKFFCTPQKSIGS